MTDQQPPSQPAAGWYPDPSGSGYQRYFDGTNWTEHSAPQSEGAVAQQPVKKGGFPKWAIPVIACLGLVVAALIIGAVAGGGDDEETRATTSTESTPTSEDAGDTTEVPTEPEETTTTEPEETTTTEPEETTTTAPPEPDGSQGSPLAVGTGTRVGDYEVTLVSVNLDGTDAILSENEFNEPPSNGAYALVTINATYVGSEEGMPNFDLAVVLQGGNGRQYSDSECGAVAPGSSETPTLTNGGNVDVQFCWDYAPEAVEGGTVFVEPLFSFDDEERVYWVVQ